MSIDHDLLIKTGQTPHQIAELLAAVDTRQGGTFLLVLFVS